MNALAFFYNRRWLPLVGPLLLLALWQLMISAQWVKPVLLFGWPIVLLTGVLSLLPHRGPMSKARSSANGSRNGKTLPAYHREISGIGHCQSHFLCRRRVR